MEIGLPSKSARSIGVVGISQTPSRAHVKCELVSAFRTAVGWGSGVRGVEIRPSAAIAWVLWMWRARSTKVGRVRPRVSGRCACAAHCSTRGFSMRTACGCRPRTLLPSDQLRQDSLAFRGGGALARDLPVVGHEERRRPRQGMMVRWVAGTRGGASEVVR